MNAPLTRRVLAELAGTALLVAIGTGAIVAGARAGGVPQWLLAVAWFAAVAFPVLVFAGVSGAHLNPAVTLGLVVARRVPWRETPAYVLGQVAGAFVGSIAVLLLLGGEGDLGATVPRGIGLLLTFLLEFTFTSALVLAVLFLTRPERPLPWVWLLLPAAVVGVSTYLIGPWTGSSLNPARSLAPGVLSGNLDALWVYLLAAPIAGLAMAAAVRLGESRSPRSTTS